MARCTGKTKHGHDCRNRVVEDSRCRWHKRPTSATMAATDVTVTPDPFGQQPRPRQSRPSTLLKRAEAGKLEVLSDPNFPLESIPNFYSQPLKGNIERLEAVERAVMQHVREGRDKEMFTILQNNSILNARTVTTALYEGLDVPARNRSYAAVAYSHLNVTNFRVSPCWDGMTYSQYPDAVVYDCQMIPQRERLAKYVEFADKYDAPPAVFQQREGFLNEESQDYYDEMDYYERAEVEYEYDDWFPSRMRHVTSDGTVTDTENVGPELAREASRWLDEHPEVRLAKRERAKVERAAEDRWANDWSAEDVEALRSVFQARQHLEGST